MAITVPYELPGIERAKLELAAIRGEYTANQKAVIDLAAKTEAGKKAFDELIESFAKGTTSAKEVREALDQLAKQAPKTSAELAKEAKEAEAAAKKQQDAFERLEEKRRGMTNGLRDTSLASGRVNAAMDSMGGSLLGAARGLGVVGVAVAAATVGLVKFGEAGAAGERQAASLRDLGATYDVVTRATNDTLTATDVLAARQTFLNSRLRISGEELAVVARYAREHKQATMTDAEAVERFSEALRGGEQDALQEWGIAVQSGATRAQTFERALRTMRREQEGTAPASRTLAEDTERLKSALEEGGSAFARMASDGLGLQSVISDIATGIRGLSRDINDMIDAQNRAPAQQAAFQRRQQSLDNYIAALRTARQESERLGIDRSALPSANPNHLTDEQRDALTTRLRSLTTGLQNRGAAPVTEAAIATGTRTQYRGRFDVTQAPAITTNDADLDAMLAGIRAAQTAGRRGGNTRLAQDRAQARAGLAAIDRDADAQIAANLRAQQAAGRQGPRDAAAQGAAQSQLDQQAIQAMQRRINTARQGYQDERDNLTAITALREREVELQVSLGRGEAETFDLETYQRLQRQEDLRTLDNTLERQRQGLQTLREELEAQREHTSSLAQRNALTDQIHTLHEDEVRFSREIASNQSEITRSTVEQARAARTRADAFQREQEQKDRGREDTSDTGRFFARQRETALDRERREQEHRLDQRESFLDRWRRMNDEEIVVNDLLADSLKTTFSTITGSLTDHLEGLASGKEKAAQFWRGLSGDVLAALGKEAFGKAAFYGAEALGFLVTGNFASAATAGAASLAFGAAGGLLTYGASELGAGGAGAAQSTAPTGGGSSGPRERPLQREQDARGGGAGGNVYNFTFGGGVVLGTPRELAQSIAGVLNDPSNGAVINARRVQ